MEKQTGCILKGIGGFYFVKTVDGKIHKCRARGNFRIRDIVPLPGDFVAISPQDGEQIGYVDEIFERKNKLVRPAVANVDILLIFVSASRPKADLLLADKLIIFANASGIEPVICINKSDENNEAAENIAKQYVNVCKAIKISAKTGDGFETLLSELNGKRVCMAGQSAVGKTSALNRISGLSLETGGLSKKTDRGKHTTRHAELIEIPYINATIADTPGFSLLDTIEMEPEELDKYYPDFSEYLGKCRFDSCIHLKEPDCAVKTAVKAGTINKSRYNRYTDIINELKEKRANKYV